MMASIPPAEVLARFMQGRGPVDPSPVSSCRALGLVAAGMTGPATGLPTRPMAGIGGLACRALDLMGASGTAPLMMMRPLTPVRPGDDLPDGDDAVIDGSGAQALVGMTLVSVEALPGEGVIAQAGHLAPAGALLRAGQPVGPADLALCAMAGIDRLPVRQVTVDLQGDDGPSRRLLAALLQAEGCRIGPGGPLRLRITPEAGSGTRLALEGAESASVMSDADGIALDLPDLVDAVLSCWLALIRPAIDHLTARQRPEMPALALGRKIASPLGLAQVVLLTREADGWLPRAPGSLSLDIWRQARAFVIIPPQDEGLAQGSPVTPMPLHATE